MKLLTGENPPYRVRGIHHKIVCMPHRNSRCICKVIVFHL
jgi:hypothetical protein